jgi:uncharacterized protein YbjT (DUF2867 family)
MAELVLVTGGSGYVGGWCIAELLRRGYEVRTTVRDPGREQAVADALDCARSLIAHRGRLGAVVAVRRPDRDVGRLEGVVHRAR